MIAFLVSGAYLGHNLRQLCLLLRSQALDCLQRCIRLRSRLLGGEVGESGPLLLPTIATLQHVAD